MREIPLRPYRLIFFVIICLFAAILCLALVWLSWPRSGQNAVEQRAYSPAPALTEPSQSVDFTERSAVRRWRIAFIPKFKYYGETGRLSAYWQPAWVGAMKAGVDFGVEVELIASRVPGNTDAEYVEPQIRLVMDLISRGNIDGIVIAPFDSNRLAPVVDKAVTAGIPVIAMDTPVNSDRVLTLVAFNNFTAGEEVGLWVVKASGGRGRVLILDGPQDQQNAVNRRQGFLAGLQQGDMDVLNTKSADWETKPAFAITSEWLSIYRDVGAIMSANDNMAIGAAHAVAQAGRAGMIITGFDATDEALSAIRDGRISATVDQMPGAQARLAIQLLIRHLETGERFPAIIYLPKIAIITKENIDAFTR